MVKHYKQSSEISNLTERKSFLEGEIKQLIVEKEAILNDADFREKVAREQYLMKKENEDVFLIR